MSRREEPWDVSAHEPDAWDECAACGHDREEHDRVGCLAVVQPHVFQGITSVGGLCGCVGFVEERP